MNSASVHEFYQGYLDKVKNGTVVENLIESGDKLSDLVLTISEEQSMHAYDQGKWTIKELVQHMNDCERVFSYRALTFARNDHHDLPGFDENTYAAESFANERKMSAILNEFHIVRAGSIDLFSSFTSRVMDRKGTANGTEFSVELLGYIISGHTLHHLEILKERYLDAN